MVRYFFLFSDRSAHTKDQNFGMFDQNMFCQAISARRATTTTATTAKEFLAQARPGISTHPGIKYPVPGNPLAPIK